MQHIISISEITDGDHIYVRPGMGFTMSKEGIAVPTQDGTRSARWMVITNDVVQTDGNYPQLRLVTLDEFRASELKLRRVFYDQVDAVLHHFKLSGTSYAETRVPSDTIVNNALILHLISQSSDVYGDRLKILLGNRYERFSYICSTTYAKDWTLMLDLNDVDLQLFSDGLQDSSPISETVQGASRESDSSSRGYDWSHAIKISDLRRGNHIYAWRKGFIYQHHAIVIAKSDVPEEFRRTHSIPIIEDLMVIENNKTESPCIRIVTLAHFSGNYRIRRVQYGRNSLTDVFINDIKMRGKIYLQDSLSADDVITNALYLYRRSNYRSQQWEATCDLVSRGAMTTAWYALEKTDAWKYLVEKLLPFMKGFSRPILRTMAQGVPFRQSLHSFLGAAGPVAGIVAAITCFLEIGVLTIRYVVYRLSEGLDRIKVLALGIALELAKFVKGVCQAIVSNGLSAVFSLIGGALGLLVPIPFVNFLLSAAFGFTGLALGRYLAGIPVNLYLRHKYLEERDQAHTE